MGWGVSSLTYAGSRSPSSDPAAFLGRINNGGTNMIVVSAAALRSGHRIIQVSDCNGSTEAANAIRNRDAILFARAEERQTVVYDTLADARSGVMSDFGMGWFNLARRQLDNPPVAVGMGAPARATGTEGA